MPLRYVTVTILSWPLCTFVHMLDPNASTPCTPEGLRLLDVTDFYSDQASGGVKTYLHAKAERLQAFGIEHAIAVPGNADELAQVGPSRLHRIRGPRVAGSSGYRLLLRPEPLATVVQAEQPDIIEVGSPFFVPRVLQRALGSKRIPLVGFYHADIVRTFAEPYVPHRIAAPLRVVARNVARRLIRSVYSTFDVTVAASASVAQELRGLGVPCVREISLGVDLDLFHPDAAARACVTPFDDEASSCTRALADLRRDGPVGLYVGRFCVEKRLDIVVDAHAQVPLSRRPHLVLVGGGPQFDALKARARTQERLSVLPYVRDRMQLAALYASADFYVAAGPGETFGLAIGEALASGLPVVTVARGAGPDRVANSGASVSYTHGQARDCARALEAMARWVETDRDELRHRARSHAEATLDWNHTVAELVALYQELATSRSTSRAVVDRLVAH